MGGDLIVLMRKYCKDKRIEERVKRGGENFVNAAPQEPGSHAEERKRPAEPNLAALIALRFWIKIRLGNE